MVAAAPPQFASMVLAGLTFVGVTVSAGATILAHADALAGDVAVLVDRSDHSSQPPSVTPAGFVTIFDSPTSGWQSAHVISAGLLLTGAAEAVTGMSVGSSRLSKLLFVFRPDGVVSSMSPISTDSSLTNGDPGLSTAPVGSATPVIIAIGAVGSSGTPNLQSSSPSLQQVTLQGGIRAGFNIYKVGDTPLSQTADTQDNGSNNISIAALIKLNSL